jgi:hypothetical protein
MLINLFILIIILFITMIVGLIYAGLDELDADTPAEE